MLLIAGAGDCQPRHAFGQPCAWLANPGQSGDLPYWGWCVSPVPRHSHQQRLRRDSHSQDHFWWVQHYWGIHFYFSNNYLYDMRNKNTTNWITISIVLRIIILVNVVKFLSTWVRKFASIDFNLGSKCCQNTSTKLKGNKRHVLEATHLKVLMKSNNFQLWYIYNSNYKKFSCQWFTKKRWTCQLL